LRKETKIKLEINRHKIAEGGGEIEEKGSRHINEEEKDGTRFHLDLD